VETDEGLKDDDEYDEKVEWNCGAEDLVEVG
jgi:hypothetical protein